MKAYALYNRAKDEQGRPAGMLDGYKQGHLLEMVGRFEIDKDLDAKEIIWAAMNRGSGRESDQLEGQRSMSVGDVVWTRDEVGSTAWYAVAPFGWDRIDTPTNVIL